MTSFATDPQIELIRKLLKQAESAAKVGNQTEADSFNEKAAQLIAKWGVDQARLAAEEKIEDLIVSERIALPDTYTRDLRILLYGITTSLGAQMITNKIRRPDTVQSYTYTAHIFAHQSTFNRIVFLFDLLQSQMLLGAAAASVPTWENARSFRKSWMDGFSAAIRARLKRTEHEAAVDAEKPAIASGASMEVVLFDRNKAVEDRFQLAYPKGTIVKSYRILNGSGRSQGYAAGKRADLGNGVGGSRTALTG